MKKLQNGRCIILSFCYRKGLIASKKTPTTTKNRSKPWIHNSILEISCSRNLVPDRLNEPSNQQIKRGAIITMNSLLRLRCFQMSNICIRTRSQENRSSETIFRNLHLAQASSPLHSPTQTTLTKQFCHTLLERPRKKNRWSLLSSFRLHNTRQDQSLFTMFQLLVSCRPMK